LACVATHRVSDATLAQAEAVVRRGVDIAQACVAGSIQRGSGLYVVDRRIQVAQRSRAEADLAQLQRGAAKLARREWRLSHGASVHALAPIRRRCSRADSSRAVLRPRRAIGIGIAIQRRVEHADAEARLRRSDVAT